MSKQLSLSQLLDIIFIPSSFVREVRGMNKRGEFQSRIYESEFWKKFCNIKPLPYLSALLIEGARLYIYYEIGRKIVEKLQA